MSKMTWVILGLFCVIYGGLSFFGIRPETFIGLVENHITIWQRLTSALLIVVGGYILFRQVNQKPK